MDGEELHDALMVWSLGKIGEGNYEGSLISYLSLQVINAINKAQHYIINGEAK